mmetsp:Transcript_28032/g.68254  ORF Transcript_28032/g.68254 Transcript_28032/m.68254 type:complete len:103 (+) Transcript_28032:689-997(+)
MLNTSLEKTSRVETSRQYNIHYFSVQTNNKFKTYAMIDFFPLGTKTTKQSSLSGCKVATYDTALQGLRIAPRTNSSAVIVEIEETILILLICQLDDKFAIAI